MKVYFDNAATTPLAPEVIRVMQEVMQDHYGNPSSVHSIGRKSRTLVEESRKTVAEILRASIGEIFFTSSATESNNMALRCSVRDLGVTHIVTSPTEHPCVLNTLKSLAETHQGIKISFLSVDSRGNIDINELEKTIKGTDEKTLVSLMHGNNEIGTMIDIRRVADTIATAGALFHCDSVQTIAKYDIDVNEIPISFLTGSGHKIYGPKGAGMIYINSNNQIRPFIDGGGQERKMRSGTENVYGIVGFARAMKDLYDQRDFFHKKTNLIRSFIKKEIARRKLDIEYNGNQEELYLSHILNMSLPRNDRTELIMFQLDMRGICASAGSACSSGAVKHSHVNQAIGLSDDRKALRLSLSHHNTEEEARYVVDVLEELLKT